MKYTIYLFFLLYSSIALSQKKQDMQRSIWGDGSNVLILNSYYHEAGRGSELERAISRHLHAKQDIAIQREELGHLHNVPYDEATRLFQHMLDQYLKKPQCIVITGDIAWDLYRKNFPCSWKNIPIILHTLGDTLYDFEYFKRTLDNPNVAVPNHLKKVLSYKESYQGFNIFHISQPYIVEEVFHLIFDIYSNDVKIALITDRDFYSYICLNRLEEIRKRNEIGQLMLLQKENMRTSELIHIVNDLDSTTIPVLVCWQLEEIDRHLYNEYSLFHRQLTSSFHNPTFLNSSSAIWNHVGGGGVSSHGDRFNMEVAKIVDTLLYSNLTPRLNRNLPLLPWVDYQVFRRFNDWNDDISDIPNIEIYRKPLSYYEKHKTELFFLWIFFILAIVIIVFWYLSYKKKKEIGQRQRKLITDSLALYDNMPVLHARVKIVYDEEGDIEDIVLIACNKAYTQELGTRGALLKGESFKEKNNQPFPDEWKLMLIDVDRFKNKGGGQYSVPSEKGEIHFKVHTYPSIKDGMVDFYYTNVSELIQAQSKVAKYKERLFSMYMNLPIAVALLDLDCKITEYNKAFSEVFYTPNNSKGCKLDPNCFDILLGQEEISKIQSDKFSSRELEITPELVKSLGGDLHYKIKRDFWCVVEPLQVDQSEKEGYVVLLIDHTEINRAIEEIHRITKMNEETLSTILDNLTVGVVIKDADEGFKYIYCNGSAQSLMGIDDTIIGRTDEELWKESLVTKYRNEDTYLMNNRDEEIEHEEFINGRTYIKRKRLIKGKDGNNWIIVSSWDITIRRETEKLLELAKEQAEESNRLKSAFLANMSHEIRTPLNAIVGFSEVLADAETEEERREYAQHISRNNEVLLQLIGDILDLSKIESQTLDFTYGEANINKIMIGIESQSRLRLKNKGVDVQLSMGLNRCVCKTDGVRLSQVLNNLVSNAMKFTKDGYIKVGYDLCDDGMLEFFVEDTGCGIQKDKVDSVFERFVKLNSFVQGSGLGLSICKTIIDRLGGKIGVDSEYGKGSRFWFTIPYVSATKVEKIDIFNRKEQLDGTNQNVKYKLLIAEDNESNYILFKTLLSSRFDIVHAENGEQAIKKYEIHQPDLVLMDIHMPIMDGYEATNLLRNQNVSIPIVAVTAYAFAEDEIRILNSGFNGIIKKPIKSKEFLRQVESYIELFSNQSLSSSE